VAGGFVGNIQLIYAKWIYWKINLQQLNGYGIICAMSEAMKSIVEHREDMLNVPKVGEIVSGQVIDKARNALYLDLGHLGVGVIYGRELLEDSEKFRETKLGDQLNATIQSLDNEDELIELSLRSISIEQSWKEIKSVLESGDILEVEILDANKGGLIVRIQGVTGFLPVSQLAPDHYPRVEGGDKNKILERLKSYVQEKFRVKVIGAERDSEKLIVSEKAAIGDEMSHILKDINEGDIVEGTVSGIVEFGIFIKFNKGENELEGLVHISELAWQRIDNPGDIVGVGEKIKARVIGVDGLRISLSIKQLQDDPWSQVEKKYKVGDEVKGEVIKVTPFGGFIKLDDDIHGLVHVSELPPEFATDPNSVLEVSKKIKFKIISLQPKEHRLGLSLK
jgi:small subunit ribosomal protein S1